MKITRLLFAFLLVVFFGQVIASCPNPPTQGCAGMQLLPGGGNGSVDQTTIDGINVVFLSPSGAHTNGMVKDHGGSGDQISYCQNLAECNKTPVYYNVLNAVWSSLNGGTTVFMLDKDPTINRNVGLGHEFDTQGITSSGGTGVGFNGQWSVVAVDGPTKTVSVVQQAFSSPGTFVSATTNSGTAYIINASTVTWTLSNLYGTVSAYPQGPFPQGGADAANTGICQGYISGTIYTCVTPTSGIIAGGMSPTLTGAGVTPGTIITGFLGPSAGYAGQYSVNISQTVGSVGSLVALSSNGCLYAGKTTTWSNKVTTTCVDTTQLHRDIVAYLHSHYGVPLNHMAFLGLSNGGFNGEVLGLDAQGLFQWIGLISGPMSTYYIQFPVTPTTVAAIWGSSGAEDLTLCTNVAYGLSVGSNCSGQPNQFTATETNFTLHVTARANGTQHLGSFINCAGSAPGTYIVSQTATAPGDIATYLTNISQSFPSTPTCNSDNIWDSYWFQNTQNKSFADIITPLTLSEIGMTYTIANWANWFCNAGLGSQINLSDMVDSPVAIGHQLSVDYCSGFVHWQILSSAGHGVVSQEQALHANLLAQFSAWVAGHKMSEIDARTFYASANDPVFYGLAANQ